MRIENCILTGDFIVTAPLTRTEAEEEWVGALNSGAIPSPLFNLYSRAAFLSFGGAPSFLQDGEHILFSYFSMLLRSVMESLVDADQQLKSFVEVQKLAHTPAKNMRPQSSHQPAHPRARPHL